MESSTRIQPPTGAGAPGPWKTWMLYWSAKYWMLYWMLYSLATRKDATAPGSRIGGGLYTGTKKSDRRPAEASSKNSRRAPVAFAKVTLTTVKLTCIR